MKKIQAIPEDVAKGLRHIGLKVRIYPLAKIVRPEMVSIGDCSMIDDFVFINGGAGTKIGKYVHVASFVSVIGGGVLEVGDYSVLACGARILTGTDTPHGGKRMTTALPENKRSIKRGYVRMGRDVFIGTNSVVHPNVTIGDGAVIGSCSLVTHDVEPWSINYGAPCKRVGTREFVEEE